MTPNPNDYVRTVNGETYFFIDGLIATLIESGHDPLVATQEATKLLADAGAGTQTHNFSVPDVPWQERGQYAKKLTLPINAIIEGVMHPNNKIDYEVGGLPQPMKQRALALALDTVTRLTNIVINPDHPGLHLSSLTNSIQSILANHATLYSFAGPYRQILRDVDRYGRCTTTANVHPDLEILLEHRHNIKRNQEGFWEPALAPDIEARLAKLHDELPDFPRDHEAHILMEKLVTHILGDTKPPSRATTDLIEHRINEIANRAWFRRDTIRAGWVNQEPKWKRLDTIVPIFSPPEAAFMDIADVQVVVPSYAIDGENLVYLHCLGPYAAIQAIRRSLRTDAVRQIAYVSIKNTSKLELHMRRLPSTWELIAVHPACTGRAENRVYLLGNEPEELPDVFTSATRATSPYPLLPEWLPTIYREARSNNAINPTSRHKGIVSAYLDYGRLQRVIQQALDNGLIAMPDPKPGKEEEHAPQC